MHEGGLCEGVLAVVLDAAADRPVARVQLQIGQLQRVVADSFHFYWQMLAAGTPAATASVSITEVPMRIRCRSCGAEHEPLDAVFLCRACESADVELIAGDQVAVESIELEGGEVVRNPQFAGIHEDHTHIHG